MNPLKLTLIALAVLGTGFVVTDCSTGNTVHDEGSVSGKYYKPAWTETDVSVDVDGSVSIDTTHHPEEFHVVVDVDGCQRDFNAGRQTHFTVTNGQFVTIQSRKGKWTGWKYLGRISL